MDVIYFKIFKMNKVDNKLLKMIKNFKDKESLIIPIKANTLMEKTNSRNLVMKLGREGFIAYESERDGFVKRQHFPSLSINPVDVSGAGDSLLAALSVGLCSGATLMESSAIGAGMASLAVQQIGNIPVSNQQLKNYISQI